MKTFSPGCTSLQLAADLQFLRVGIVLQAFDPGALLLDLFRQIGVALFQFLDLRLLLHQRGNPLRTAKGVNAESDHQDNGDRISATDSKRISSLAWKIIVTSVGGCFPKFFAMTDKIVVLSTCASAEEAEKIARRLVEIRLAACVNVLAGRAQLLSLERRHRKLGRMAAASSRPPAHVSTSFAPSWRRLHSYEVPEIIALPIVDGARQLPELAGSGNP